MAESARGLRAEVEAAAIEEAARIGPDGFDRAGLVNRFLGREASRATIYRWVDAFLKSGRVGQHIGRKVRKAAARRAKRSPDPAADAAAEVVEQLPAAIRVEDVAGIGGTIPVIEKLNECIAIADKLIKHSQGADGGVRNAKLMLSASEHLRRSLETSVRLHEAIMGTIQVERFQAAIFTVLRRKDPLMVEEVLAELRVLNAQWGLAG